MTISALYAWPDYDEHDKWNGASILGTYHGEAMAVVIKSRHHDEFLRLALAAPDLLDALQAISKLAASFLPYDDDGSSFTGEAFARILRHTQTAIAKAKRA